VANSLAIVGVLHSLSLRASDATKSDQVNDIKEPGSHGEVREAQNAPETTADSKQAPAASADKPQGMEDDVSGRLNGRRRLEDLEPVPVLLLFPGQVFRGDDPDHFLDARFPLGDLEHRRMAEFDQAFLEGFLANDVGGSLIVDKLADAASH
jgi:hypothetical protein